MPDEYDSVRRNMSNYEKGLYFELGRAHERGETPEKGWVRQFEIRTSEGPRVLDSARTEGRGTRSVERKSGRVNERDAHEQLKKERAGLESQQLTHSTWETVEGEKLPDKVREDMHELARDFPGRFHHEIVSRADAARAIRLGQSLVSKQLELIRAYELTRADRARKRLEKIREIVRVREQRATVEREQARVLEQEQRMRDKELFRSLDTRELDQKKELLRVQVAEQSREIAEAREKGRTLDIEKQRESHTKSVKGLDEVREIERAKTRDMLTASGLGREQVKEMEKILGENRENQRKDVVRELEAIGSVIKSEEKIRADREAIEKQREQIREARERAIRAGVPRDVLHVWEVSRLQPGETPDPHPNTKCPRTVTTEKQRGNANVQPSVNAIVDTEATSLGLTVV